MEKTGHESENAVYNAIDGFWKPRNWPDDLKKFVDRMLENLFLDKEIPKGRRFWVWTYVFLCWPAMGII